MKSNFKLEPHLKAFVYETANSKTYPAFEVISIIISILILLYYRW